MRTQQGFSLLETLVALVVVALAVGTLLPALLASLDRVEADALRAAAHAVAHNQIERHAVIATDTEGRFEGREGAFSWTAAIDRVAERPEARAAASAFVLRRIHVVVFAEQGQPLASLALHRVGVIR